MRDESDFAAYLAARWGPVVRTVALLGCPQGDSEAVAGAAFARCSLAWDRVRGAGDPDVEVYRTVLDCWARARRAGWRDGSVPVPAVEPLEAVLDRLTPEVRAALALRAAAGLTPVQVAEVLETSVVSDPDAPIPADALREAAEAIDVPPAPLAAVLADARAHRGVRRRRLVAALAGAAAVVALGTWLGTRDGPAELAPVAVTPAENPAPVAWWAGNVLHLAHVTLELPPPGQLAEVTGGAVYTDQKGAVVFVADDGSREAWGRTAPGAPVVVSDEDGLAAWAEPHGAATQLVVWDLTGRQELIRRPLPDPRSHPIALDQATVYYATAAGNYAFALRAGDTVERVEDGLLDVASATRVLQGDPGSIEIVQPFFSITFRRPGRGAQLSPDGDYALTRDPGDRSAYAPVHVYDTRSGDEVPTGVAGSEVVVAARLGERDTVTWVVARAEDRPEADEFVRLSFSGPFELRTCTLTTGECVLDARISSVASTPVLGR